MPRKRQIAKKSRSVISDNLRAFLLTGERAKGNAEIFRLSGSRDRLRAVWDAVKNEITRDWTKQYPASRPMLWWEFDAPKEPIKGWADMGFEKAQRKRLGGVGTPTFEVLACGLSFACGIPMSYVDQWECDYYNGRARDIHGNPIGTDFKEGDFDGVAFDENDPPCFESEAAYLERHGLLSDAEKAYLIKHKELLKPEKVIFEADEED